jgi:uncharacterized repeat protein (TIGR01451 family)
MYFSMNLSAQCGAPEILNWTATDDIDFDLTFYAPESGLYNLWVDVEYEWASTLYIIEATEGINYLELSFGSLFGFNIPDDASGYYFTCILEYDECLSGAAEETKFYLSSHSLLSTGDVDCNELIMPIQYLSDGVGFMVQTILEVPEYSGLVESIQVFVDIGHQNNSDLSIELEHPSGEIITLMDYDFTSGNTTGFSVLFSDNGTDLPENSSDLIGPRGLFLPEEPLSTFNGLPSEGEWILRVQDGLGADVGAVFGACVSITCQTGFSGQVYFDLNSNNSLDSNEAGFSYAEVLNSIDGEFLYTSEEGIFNELCAMPGNGELSITNAPEYWLASDLGIEIINGTTSEAFEIPLIPISEVVDIDVDLYTISPNRPGFEANYQVSINNLGTLCESDINVDIEFPEYVEILSSTHPDLVIFGSSAIMEIGEVCPFTPLEFELTIILDDTVSIGTELEATLTANESPNDVDVSNNFFMSNVVVVGSYDPNDKQVSHETIGDDFLEDGTPLKYTIRFQNTGTFYAERVVIADTIDANLDLNSLQILSTSHNLELSREGNVLYFEYDQIFLPDSTTDFDGSIGYVRYQIDPFPSFNAGETIENTAYIYFDFNEPIVTNTVVTEFGNPPLSTNEKTIITSIYPNPTKDRITATWNSDFAPERVEIFDLTGRLLMEELALGSNLLEIELSDFPQGLYIIRFISEGFVSENKFVKE